MRNDTTQKTMERLVDGALAKVPERLKEETRDLTAAMSKELGKIALSSTDLGDITTAKMLVRIGYTLGALHYADLDLLIRQDLAREAEARGE